MTYHKSLWNPRQIQVCHDCNAGEGELHRLGCDMEACPRCRGQLISCGCFDVPLNWSPTDSRTKKKLEKIGRIPYFQPVNLCARCGEVWPDMFKAADWKEIIPHPYQDDALCLKCYEFVRAVMLWRRAGSPGRFKLKDYGPLPLESLDDKKRRLASAGTPVLEGKKAIDYMIALREAKLARGKEGRRAKP